MNDLTGSNSELAASHNRGVILRAIQRHQPISRTELAQRSGLTKQTVTRIAERLIGEKLVLEARRRHGQPGQPSIELEINPDGCHSIGAYIARDHVAVVAIDASGAVRGRIHTEVAFALPEQAIGLIEEAFATFKRRRTIDERRLAGLGIALPDWLGEIPFPGMPAAYASWTGYDVRGRVAAFTDLPLYIENDAIAAAIGELNYGLGVESRSFFYIFIGSGLGGAVVLDGVCHHGVTGLSGEIGWLPTLAADMPEGSRIQPLGQLVSLYVLYEFMAAHGITITAPADLLSLDLRGRALVSDWLRGALHRRRRDPYRTAHRSGCGADRRPSAGAAARRDAELCERIPGARSPPRPGHPPCRRLRGCDRARRRDHAARRGAAARIL